MRNRPRNSNSVRKRIFRKAIITLLIIGIPVILFLFTFSIKKMDVVGANRYTPKQIRELVLKSRLDYNSAFLYLKYRFFTTPDIPFVEKLDIEMNSNHKVTVYVYEKMITGCVNIMGEYLYFDKDGIVVESSSKKMKNVPVIEGLQFNEIVLHEKLNLLNNEQIDDQNTEKNSDQNSEQNSDQNTEQNSNQNKEQNSDQNTEQNNNQNNDLKDTQNNKLFDVILNITKLINKYKLDVDAVRFDENENVTLKCGDVKVLLGKKSDYYMALSDLKNILKNAEGTQLYELDMRNYEKGSGYVIGKTKDSTE